MDNQNPTISSIQTCGLYTGGDFTAKNITINVNPSRPSRSDSYFPTLTRYFKGRRDTMEAVRNYFITLPPQPKDCWQRIVAIVGLGGMGKTETATKFALDNKELFPTVVWIDAETAQSALTSFLDFAKYLGIIPQGTEKADLSLVKKVYRELDRRDRGGVLLILDNAAQLYSDGLGFGIYELLPTEDLPNQRFPHVLITTQTFNWGRRIVTFQIDALTEDESLEFFRSSLKVEDAKCDEEFKKLHQLLQGYPLVINLVAAQIDDYPKRDSVNQLKQQIHNYIYKLAKEQDRSRTSQESYNKILSSVWQLTYERIQQEENGRDALELLQFMSFLHVPIDSRDLERMLVRCSDCPHPPTKELKLRMKELIRTLERFYNVRILKVRWDDEGGFDCDLGIHRLLQLIVRQQMDSSEVLEHVLFYYARDYDHNYSLNEAALEETLDRIQLSQRALLFVGILACYGCRPARKIVEKSQPKTQAAATIWRLYNLERGMKTLNENATQVLLELMELTKSEELLKDRQFFAQITIHLLADKNYFTYKSDDGTQVLGYFDLDNFDGVEELVVQFIMNVSSLEDVSCKYANCQRDRDRRDVGVSALTALLTKASIRDDTSKPKLTVNSLADTWFALIARLRYYDADTEDYPNFFGRFWNDAYELFHSADASPSRLAELRTCLWNRGLAMEVIQILGHISDCFIQNENPAIFFFSLMDVCIDGIDLQDERVQEVISSFCRLIATIETKYTSQKYSVVPAKWKNFVVNVCSVWIKLFLMSDEPSSHKLSESLSRLKFLDWIERNPTGLWMPTFGNQSRWGSIPGEYFSEHFPAFIQKYSSSGKAGIKKLTEFCRQAIQNKKSSHCTISAIHNYVGSPTTSKGLFRYHVPTPTLYFKGRRDTMEALRSHFISLPSQPTDCLQRIVAIVGLGGMGKTETACKFAAEFQQTFPNVAWINAETESSILESFLGLAKHLKIVSNDRKEADVDLVMEVYRHIDQEDFGRVLFIFDNAIRFHSDPPEFGINEYLPTEDLPNQRFPYALITSQTQDWGRRIKTFQIDELSEEESLEFFRSCFEIKSPECDDLFKKLYELLGGYPLVMNLTASQVDYHPKIHSVNELKQQIQYYIEKLQNENSELFHENLNQQWPSNYNKTLSNVWQLTFQRLQQEIDGGDALELLQLMSFLHAPIWSTDVVEILVLRSNCPHPSKKELEFRVKELFDLLRRFYVARVLKVRWNDEDGFNCYLGMNRLVQLVVRQLVDSSRVLESVLFYLTNDYKHTQGAVYVSALEKALYRSRLSQRALPYVGILACHGIPAAIRFVETQQPEREAAVTIWRLYYLERGMATLNDNAIQVLRELIGLTKHAERLMDRQYFAHITMLTFLDPETFKHKRKDGTEVPGYFNLTTFDGVEELVTQLLRNVRSLTGSLCDSDVCDEIRDYLDKKVTALTSKFPEADEIQYAALEPQARQSAALKSHASVSTELKPQASQSTALKPQASQPDALKPQASQPDALKPQASQPDALKPQASQPDALKPQASQPDALKPQASQPDALKPQASQPDALKPQASQPDALKPQGSQPDALKPQASQPDALKPQASQPDALKPQASQPDALKPQASQPDALKPQGSQPDALKPQASQPDALKPQASQPDALKLQASQPDTLKPQASPPASPQPPPSLVSSIKDNTIQETRRSCQKDETDSSLQMRVDSPLDLFLKHFKAARSPAISDFEQLPGAIALRQPLGISTVTRTPPLCFDVPTPPRHFTGRMKTMEDIRDYFKALPPRPIDCWERIVAIVGQGGIGKTEIATKFATTFPNAKWVNAETEHATLKSFLELAKDLRIVEENRKSADVKLVVKIYRHIDEEEYGKFLIIFDNAILLKSEGPKFGIHDYLPMEDLPNQRFPYIIITTQATDWIREFKSIQVGALNENESLEFFRSFFQIVSPVCDGVFKKLHELLQGHPLLMNLAASQIEHDPNKGSVYQLQQQINQYVEQVQTLQNRTLGTNILSILCRMTFQRVAQEVHGPVALEILQIMSFLNLPVRSHDVKKILVASTECPHLPDWELHFKVEQLIQVLEQFSVARILKRGLRGEILEVGLNELVQSEVREGTLCAKALERVLLYSAHEPYWKDVVNTSALEEVLPRTQLSSQILPYVGILACDGNKAASEIVESREPTTATAATIWRLYHLERGMTTLNENAVQVLKELVDLTKSAVRKKDRHLFAHIAMLILLDAEASKFLRGDRKASPQNFKLGTLAGIEELVAELIVNVCLFDGLLCDSEVCSGRRVDLDEKVAAIAAKLAKVFIQLDARESQLAVERFADSCLAVLGMLKYYNLNTQNGVPHFWTKFWREMYKTFNSQSISENSIVKLRTCLWHRGLATELIQAFRSFSLRNKAVCSYFKECIDVCFDGRTLKDQSEKDVVTAFTEMTKKIKLSIVESNDNDAIDFAIDICSVWIKLLLVDPTSEFLLECLSGCEALTWIQGAEKEGMCLKIKSLHYYRIPEKYRSDYFPQFIDRYSSCETKGIQELVTFCNRMMDIERL